MVEFSLDDDHQSIAHFLEGHFLEKDFRIFQLAGDASNRRYFRVVVEEESFVLMVWEPFKDNDNYPFLSVLRCLQKNKVSAPKVLSLSEKDGLILLEDLGDLTLERKFWENQDQNLVLPYYKQSLEQLFKIHSLNSDSTNNNCTALRTSFNVEKFMWEFNYSMKHLVKEFCKVEISETQEKDLNEVFLNICERLTSQQPVVCHRDFHSRNVMIKLGLVKIIDFQDARLGPAQYDLVSLLKDSYVNLEQTLQSQLLENYFLKYKKELNPTASKEEFLRNYEVQTIQRCFKACGSFTSFFNTRGDRRYLKYIERTMKSVQKSLLLFPEYNSLYTFLNDNQFFQRKYEVR